LIVSNIGGPLVLGDTFTLFSDSAGFGGAFANLSLPTLTNGLGWLDNTGVDGTIQVIKGSVPPSLVDDLPGITNYAFVGGANAYTITAAGDPTLQYQWFLNGTTPVGSNSPTLTLTSLTVADSGYYSVTVTNDYGLISSQSNYLSVLTPSGYNALVLASGPLAYWPLNETSGTVAFDYWGGFDANYVGSYTLDQATNPVTSAGAVQFDGASSYALTPYSASLNPTVFSAEAWVNPDNVPASETCVLSCGEFASPRSGWLIYQFPTYWDFRTYYGVSTTVAAEVIGVTAPAIGSWTHLAVTWDGTTASLYVNGVLEGSQVSTTTPKYLPGTGGGFCAGARADASFFYGGNVSDAALYNRALTAQEISAHAHNQGLLSIAPAGTNVVLTWPSGSATVQASTTLNGTFTNVPGATTSPWTNSPSGGSMFFRLKF
jgi:Concanavalin A-like lectin/glucanases superfamily